MRVAHFSYGDRHGAFGAAYELHQGMLQEGVASSFFVRNKTRIDNNVIELGYCNSIEERLLRAIDRQYFDENRRDKETAPIHFDGLGIYWSQQLEEELRKFDIIHIHWVAGFLNTDNIYRLSRLNKPMIWTMHDFHPFTGGCHCPEACRGYEEDCSGCPELRENIEDITKYILLDKKRKYTSDIHIVVASVWLKALVGRSSLFGQNPCEIIPIGIDTECFRPKNMAEMKRKLGFSVSTKIILIGAQALAQRIKGYHFLKQLLPIIKEDPYCLELIKKRELVLLAFGSGDKAEQFDRELQVVSMGFIQERERLCEIYSAADVFLFPSVQDTFGMTAVEAMSCGTPTVAFDIGAMREVIIQGINGYKAEVDDCKMMAKYIIQILKSETIDKVKCRNRIVEHYSLGCEVKQMMRFYHKILSEWQGIRPLKNPLEEDGKIKSFIHKCAFEILTGTSKNQCTGMEIQDILSEYSPKFVTPEWKVRKLLENGDIDRYMPVVVYGAGYLGRRTVWELERQKVRIECFWDMDEAKEGHVMEGYCIRRPAEKGTCVNKIIIAGMDYRNMKKHLIEWGYLYGHDFF